MLNVRARRRFSQSLSVNDAQVVHTAEAENVGDAACVSQSFASTLRLSLCDKLATGGAICRSDSNVCSQVDTFGLPQTSGSSVRSLLLYYYYYLRHTYCILLYYYYCCKLLCMLEHNCTTMTMTRVLRFRRFLPCLLSPVSRRLFVAFRAELVRRRVHIVSFTRMHPVLSAATSHVPT